MKLLNKKLGILLAVGALAVTLVGCSTQKDTNKAADGKVGGEIVLYTSQPETDVQKLIEGFNKEHPDVKVNVFRSGTEEVVSKVMAEEKAGAVQADVLLVADSVTFESLKDKKLLEAYESPELKGIPAKFVDADHMYTGTKVITTGIIYNTNRVKEKITGFADLAKPSMKGEIVMPSPLYSGAAAYNVGVMTRTNGLGWEFFQGLKANESKVDKGNGAIQKAVVSGEKAVGIIVDYMANRSKKEGAPVEFVYPSEGSPAITEPVGLLKTAKNKKAAQAFIDFILSAKGQELAAQIGYTPIKEGVKAPEGLKAIGDIKSMDIDMATLFKSREEDKNHFSSIFR